VGQVVPSAEICDGLDNDCNGVVDDSVNDGFGHVTGQACCAFGNKCGTGVCTYGVYACAGSQVVCDGGSGPSPEVCDGLDNDCNSQVDDVPGKGLSCALPGGCPGVLDCQPGMGLVCTAAATGLEKCNGIDDDCDGSIDEEPDVSQNDPAIGVDCDKPMPPQDGPPCAAGKTVCKSGAVVCDGAVKPSKEVCDGVDNDCNGEVDQPNPCAGDLLCVNGQCLSKCQGGEFPCPGGFFCEGGVCVPFVVDGGGTGGAGGAGVGGSGGAGAGVGGSGGAGVGGSGASGATTGSGANGATTGSGGASNIDVYGLATGGGGCRCDLSSRGPTAYGALSLLCGLLAFGARRRDRRAGRRS
jgi:hypothetical protein